MQVGSKSHDELGKPNTICSSTAVAMHSAVVTQLTKVIGVSRVWPAPMEYARVYVVLGRPVSL